jgi:hypothetical protein
MSSDAAEHQTVFFTAHGLARLRQRGIREGIVQLLLQHADCERPVGDGCTAISFTRTGLDAARDAGLTPDLLGKLARLTAIRAEDGAVVTVQNRETCFARFQRGQARMTARERAIKAARRSRGAGSR